MLIGREHEIKILQDALRSDVSEFIAVYGRRRVGKTFLIRETYTERFTFQHAGLAGGTLKEQLFAFCSSLKDAGAEPFQKPSNWLEAFELLKDMIRASREKKKVIFFDELSWMDTARSDLLMALENFWNAWASSRKDIVLIVCSSATSWMLEHVIHSKGGLYNRLTGQIHLKPFSLRECELYIRSRGIVMNRHQIVQCYMLIGGIPFYWSFLQKGMSLPQNIDHMFFSQNAPLGREFDYLYASLFRYPEPYIAIIRALGRKKAGMTREEILAASGLSNSGDLTRRLEELETCDFIRKYSSYGAKKKGAIYQLTDFFTLFYYKFMADAPEDEHFWSNQSHSPAVNAWAGLAFERVCMQHVEQIRQKLGISGVLTEVRAWRCRPDSDKGLFGSQIDMLIVRRDQVINLCEMKYSRSEYLITAEDNRSLQHKISDFVTATGTKYAIHPTLVTMYGMMENSYSHEIQAVITAKDLFM